MEHNITHWKGIRNCRWLEWEDYVERLAVRRGKSMNQVKRLAQNRTEFKKWLSKKRGRKFVTSLRLQIKMRFVL